MTSVDPLYTLPAAAILERVAANLTRGRDWLAAHAATIDWDYLGSRGGRVRRV